MSKRKRPKAPPVVFLMPWHWAEFELDDDHVEETQGSVEADGKAAARPGPSGAHRDQHSDGVEGKA